MCRTDSADQTLGPDRHICGSKQRETEDKTQRETGRGSLIQDASILLWCLRPGIVCSNDKIVFFQLCVFFSLNIKKKILSDMAHFDMAHFVGAKHER